jgi:hypothetical protein
MIIESGGVTRKCPEKCAYRCAADVTRPDIAHHNCVGIVLASIGRTLSVSYRYLQVG